ncbi:hypothetical protein PR001_g19834 [Phytophthora rubi]|uniref:Uncharacterized protein n=1 Tax=Phytophthora rubi TaxID=129364 RepID=A0A6A3JP50_9STRA|nr:hypothetical protein PR001_g19834 [Phytophthora rubi]
MAGGIDQDAAAGCRPAAWNTTLAGPYTSSLASGLQTLDQRSRWLRTTARISSRNGLKITVSLDRPLAERRSAPEFISHLAACVPSAPLHKSPPTSMLQVSQLRALRRSTPSRLQPTLARVFASEGMGEAVVCKDEMLRALDKF